MRLCQIKMFCTAKYKKENKTKTKKQNGKATDELRKNTCKPYI